MLGVLLHSWLASLLGMDVGGQGNVVEVWIYRRKIDEESSWLISQGGVIS